MTGVPIGHRIWRASRLLSIAMARLRSYRVAALGARVGSKCLFGARARIERPWQVRFGTRCVLEPDVWFDLAEETAVADVGDRVFFGRGAHLLVTDRVSIGDDCLIGDGVIIADHRHRTLAGQTITSQGCESAPVVIGSDVLICVRAIILQGVTIGDGAVIGPGAVVTQDVRPGGLVGGPPARALGDRGAG